MVELYGGAQRREIDMVELGVVAEDEVEVVVVGVGFEGEGLVEVEGYEVVAVD